MGRTLIGFTKEKTIALKNNGLIPTVVEITEKSAPDFQLEEISSPEKEITIDPGRILNLSVIFSPTKPRKGQYDLMISVAENPKANLSFSFIGEGFSEDFILEGLSEDEGSLDFKDNVIGRQQQQTFIMKNVSQNTIRFSWQSQHEFTFSPQVGHIHPQESKEIKVNFITDKPVKYNGLKIPCQWAPIEYEYPNSPDWDDSMKIVKFVTKTSMLQQMLPPQEDNMIHTTKPSNKRLQRGASKVVKNSTTHLNVSPIPTSQTNGNETIKIVDVKPEPPYHLIDGLKPRELILKVNAISDLIRYSIDTTEISFAPTMMYQTRFVEVKITNTSMIRFDYSWVIKDFISLRTNYSQQINEIPFSVLPTTGYINPQQTCVFKISFSPLEVDDFKAKVIMQIPFLQVMDPPTINVIAFSRRPLCHFNLQMSDYLKRRHPDYNYQLPENIKVIEMFSGAIGIKTFKKFEIINPTASPYQIVWIMKSNPKNSPIECLTPNVLMSSGKRYKMSFSYLPTSVKTVEVLWEFRVVEYNISIPVLTVGRIMPNK
ncbi:hypothetical protein GPJ56_002672 [Histomonas meleagridis]|uniref:uncharacterized protein n=1 Tax=Histomonas meleagridis TaxID=135588 RepID=UPI00355A4BC6|nr:hypothetical protein GPJ56_002672 [Histomonas meleagridis]KAH0797861.1 hypothetical protein GO595_009490 [Histomonas meleagridis]